MADMLPIVLLQGERETWSGLSGIQWYLMHHRQRGPLERNNNEDVPEVWKTHTGSWADS